MRRDSNRRLAAIQAEYLTEGRPQNSTLAGSMRELFNGNTLVGWGKAGCLTEHDEEIKPVFEACLLDEGRPALYRVDKSDRWVSHPLGKPSIFSYARSRELTAVYLSWNGATEVHDWRIFGTEVGRMIDSVWEEILVGPKSGFETLLGPLPRFLQPVSAEALDFTGRVVGVTEAMETFVPSGLHDECDDLWCNAMVMVDVEESESGVDVGSGLDSYKWLYPAMLLYITAALCLAAFTFRYCLRRRWFGLLYRSAVETIK